MRFRWALSACCLLAISATVRADQPAPLPLTKVPGDAGVFFHVNAAKVWDHPLAVAARTLGVKQFKELLDEFEKATGFPLAELETFTFYIPEFTQPGDEENLAFVFTTRTPYNRDAVLKAAKNDKGKPDADGFYKYVAGPNKNGFRLHFSTPRTFAILSKDLAKAYLEAKPILQEGVIGEALKMAVSGKHTAVGAINLAKSPRDFLLQQPPPELRPYLALFKARTVTTWANLDKTIDVTVQFGAEGANNARECEDAAKTALRLFEQLLEDSKTEIENNSPNKEEASLAHVIDTVLATLKTAKVTREELNVQASATVTLDKSFLPNLAKFLFEGNSGPARVTSQNNLKQIGLAMHNYHSVHNGFPPATILGKGGKPALSWRVAVLPYLEQDALYKEFHLDEPWDSEHNIKLIKRMPQVYLLPGEKLEDAKTHYRVIVGGGALFDRLLPTGIAGITDGTSNTIMAVEAEEAVPWTKPEPLVYDPKKPLPKLLFGKNGACNILIADGSVRNIRKDIAEKTLRAIITRAGGEIVNDF